MMDVIANYPLYLLIVANAALVCGAAVALIRFESRVKDNSAFWNSPIGASMAATNNSDSVLSGFLDRRLVMLQEQIEELSRQKTPTPPSPSAELPFAYATRMAKHGASVEDLTRTCGLKKAEAQLMRRMYAQRQQAQETRTH